MIKLNTIALFDSNKFERLYPFGMFPYRIPCVYFHCYRGLTHNVKKCAVTILENIPFNYCWIGDLAYRK